MNLLTGDELDILLNRMKEIQNDERLPTSVRINALKAEVCFLQMDIDLLNEGINKDENLRNSS